MPIEVKGLDIIGRKLADFAPNIQRNAAKRGLRRGANVIAEEARIRAPKRTGALARSIKVTTNDDRGIPYARIRLRGEHAFLGVMVEFGTAPHFIAAGGSGLSARKLTQRMGAEGALNIGGNFVSGAVLHPGQAPRPFMRPALDAKAEAAVVAVRDYLAGWIAEGMPKQADETENA